MNTEKEQDWTGGELCWRYRVVVGADVEECLVCKGRCSSALGGLQQ